MKHGLIIDDNRQTAEALQASLLLWNIASRTVLNPSLAMEILKENSPDIIFLDINMPKFNGLDVLAWIKNQTNLSKTPVVIVTSDDQPETAKRVMQGGAHAIIIKPVMPDLLEVALKSANLL